ncbi:uncharacterized protein CXorf38-like isoform X1 [Rhinoraja longicauda]
MQSELNIRFNDKGYKNWIKAGLCLLKIRDCLLGFVSTEIVKFHGFLSHNNSILQRKRCTNSCRSQGTKFHVACFVCSEWKKEILNHHTNQNSTIYWGNCSPSLWPTKPWEVAKVYMPRGQANRQPEKVDVAALLNLFIFCDHFHFERQKVIEVIKCRNELMHSVEMSVSLEWMKNYRQKIFALLQEFQQIPKVEATNKMIQEIISADWNVCMTETDTMDASAEFAVEINVEEISRFEFDVIKEWIEELGLALEEQEPSPQHLNSLNTLTEFFQQNKELESVFRKELQQLFILRSSNGKDL